MSDRAVVHARVLHVVFAAAALAGCSGVDTGGEDVVHDHRADTGVAAPDTTTPDSTPSGDDVVPGDDAGGGMDFDAGGGTGDDSGTGSMDDVVVGRDVVTPVDAGPHGFPGAYSSPTIVRVGSLYHVYFAAQTIAGHHYNVPHATFTEDGNFHFVGEALPALGAQADMTAPYQVWAPGVAQIDATHWVLYYTAHQAGTTEKKCIWRATSSGPDGPFVDGFGGPLECSPSTSTLWSIDAYPVLDTHGTWHLAARIDQAGGINTISIRDLGPFGQNFAPGSTWTELTANSPSSWEQPVMENAGVVRLAPPTGMGHWFVFYSARSWSDNSYSVGYADCGTGIDGPCTKRTVSGPWLATDATNGVFGPGTPTFYTDTAGRTMMSVQAWQYSGGTSNPRNTGQIMRTYHVTIDDSYVPTATLVRVDE